MFSFTCTGTRWATAAFLLAAALMTPLSAAQEEGPRGLWLAGSGAEPVISKNFGRLSLREGILRFTSTDSTWQLPLADVRRVQVSKQADRLLEIEGTTGEIYYVTIYGPQMLVESPRKALQVIQRAMQPAAARRE